MQTATRRANIELGLGALAPERPPVGVVVANPAHVAARALLDEIAEATGVDLSNATLAGEPVLADAPVSEVALQWGDELSSGGAAASSLAPVELLVRGGPEAGRRIPLDPGLHRVGRESQISLGDPSLSADHVAFTVSADGSVTVEDAGSRNGTLVDGVSLAPGQPQALEPTQLVHAGRS